MSSRISAVGRHITSKLSTNSVVVTITGAAGQIGYALVFMVAQGRLLGPNQRIELRLLELPAASKALEGVVMELIDCAYPLVSKIVATTDATEAFKNSQIGLLVGAKPRGPGMERKDLLTQNAMIFKIQGGIIDKVADKNIKIVVVGNPANTNALILSKYAPSIPKENITSLTRLDQNRAIGQIATKCHVPVTSLKNMVIWGNHSTTQYPDINNAVIDLDGQKKTVREVVSDDKYIEKSFIPVVQKRGAQIIQYRKASSAASAASSTCDHIHDWIVGSQPGEIVCMGVLTDGKHYGIPAGLNFSMPLKCIGNGKYEVIQGLKIDAEGQKRLDATIKELSQEREVAMKAVSN